MPPDKPPRGRSAGRARTRGATPAHSVRPPIDIDRFLPYWFHLITSQLSAQMLERMRPYGVTVQRWRVLMALMNRDGSSIGELAQLTLIPQSALSRVIDQMERDGLVARRPSSHDRRVVQVHLTNHGRTMYRSLAPTVEDHAENIVVLFDPHEREVLLEMLRRIARNLGVREPEPANSPGTAVCPVLAEPGPRLADPREADRTDLGRVHDV